MAEHIVKFEAVAEPVRVPTGTLLSEAAKLAGVDIMQPCGGQGRCGRCALQVTEGSVRRRSTVRLSAEDIEKGFALACQSVIEADVRVAVPPQEKIERLLTSDRTVAKVTVPHGYNPRIDQAIQRVKVTLTPPDMSDQTDDWSRLKIALCRQVNAEDIRVSLNQLQNIGQILRQEDWRVTAILIPPRV
jgi:uncharacterized 2Fe-2S/4Fe-4S cluster protein (DUF4445 family)